ncbi:hypothetical protein [Chryseobacterium angstadtii]|uniref:hypothetical protein n=1 Tax=Chryseobacterium angstadtii TaxID=558151 RepID=UPI00065AA589|nr:hypothetical protein [Chryseobacterium angstadtii]
MQFDFMIIHIGEFIRLKVIELELDSAAISSFFQCTEADIEEMYRSKSMSIQNLQKWGELLEHNFFANLCLASYSSCSKDIG